MVLDSGVIFPLHDFSEVLPLAVLVVTSPFCPIFPLTSLLAVPLILQTPLPRQLYPNNLISHFFHNLRVLINIIIIKHLLLCILL